MFESADYLAPVSDDFFGAPTDFKKRFGMSRSTLFLAVLSALCFLPPTFAADATTGASVQAQTPAVRGTEGVRTMAPKGGDKLPDNLDAVTSASVVPANLRQTSYQPKGFTQAKDKKRVLFILDDPRTNSVTYDLCVTAMKFFEEKGYEVALRDLIRMGFQPLINTPEEFYHAKDGFGPTPADVKVEQDYVRQADHLIFVMPNWQDTDLQYTKGWKVRVFSKGFGYDDGPSGRHGLLTGKTYYSIMNSGWNGMGRGQSGDALNENPQEWETWMFTFRTIDDDNMQIGMGMKTLGRFVNDQTPANTDPDYAKKINELRQTLRAHLARDFKIQ